MTAPHLTAEFEDSSPDDLMPGNITDSESIEVVQCSRSLLDNLEKLTVNENNSKVPSNNTSYSQDDIYILDPHDSHYNHLTQCEVTQSFNVPNLTVLNVDNEHMPALKKVIESHNPLEESTGVIILYRQGKSTRATSGTDSDVEILMSDGIVSSEGSLYNARRLVALSPTDNEEEMESEESDHGELKPALNFPNCTEEDLNTEELSQESMEEYNMMTHAQLIKLIKQQAIKMHSMEATLKRYRELQNALFMHVDELRAELKQFDNQVVRNPDGGELNKSIPIN